MRGHARVQRYRFGDFALDMAKRELRRDGSVLNLSPKVFDCLVYLIEQREQAVGHDELVAAVWGRVDVAEVQLRHLVRKVRYVVDVDASLQSSIRTIPRFGYRWIKEIVVEDESLPASLPPDQQLITGTMRVNKKAVGFRAASVVIAIALVAIVAWKSLFLHDVFRAQSSVSNSKQLPHSTVAVLPVETPGIEEDTAWMRLGLMDLIGKHLRGSGLAVVPSSDIVALESGDRHGKTLASVVRESNEAAYVVTTHITRDHDGWTVKATLDRDSGPSSDLEGRSPDVMVAVQQVCDRLLGELGKHPATSSSDPEAIALAQLRQRVEAASLAGNIKSAQRILDEAPAVLKANPQTLLLRAKIDLAGGDAEHVDAQLGEMLRTVEPEADPVFRAEILNEMGAAERQTGKWNLAEQRFDESIRLLETTSQSLPLGRAYAGRAAIGTLLGRYDDAEADFAHARVAFEVAGDALEVARTEMNQGTLEAIRGHPSQGVSLLTHSVEGLERFNDHSWVVNALANLISAQLDLLQSGDAAATAERMNQELPEMGSSINARVARLQYVPALLQSGHLRDARELVADLRRVEESRGEHTLLGVISLYEAELAFEDHRWQFALDAAQSSKDDLIDSEHKDERSMAWLIEFRALRALRREADASAEARKFSTWANEQHSPLPTLHAQLAQAEQAWGEGRVDAGSELYDIALHSAHERGLPADISEVVLSYGGALLESGDFARAASIVEQINPWADHDFECALLETRLYRALGWRQPWQAALDRARSLAGERELPTDATGPLAKPTASFANSR